MVVGRGDLERPGPEGRVDHVVRDDRHVAVHERDPDAPSDEGLVARIEGMDRDRGVSEERLGSRGRDGDGGVGIGPAGRLVDQVVPDRPERAGLRRRDDLEVADARPAPGAPVDQGLRTVGEAVAIEPLERDADGGGRPLVHRVAQAAPVGRGPHPSLLPEHDRLRGIAEGPHPLEIALAAQGLAALAFLGEDPIEDELGGDAGVVEPGQEERRMPAQPGVPDHQVLDRGALRVAQVERARDVRWRLDDRERRQGRIRGRATTVRREDVGLEPALVDRALDLARGIGLGEPGHLALPSRHLVVLGLRKQNGPLVQRTNGSWYHLLVRRLGRVAHRDRRFRTPSRRAIGRHPHGSRATFTPAVPRGSHRPTLAWWPVPALLLSVVAVRAGV